MTTNPIEIKHAAGGFPYTCMAGTKCVGMAGVDAAGNRYMILTSKGKGLVAWNGDETTDAVPAKLVTEFTPAPANAIDALCDAFVAGLRKTLGAEKFAALCSLERDQPATGGACHSQDFCDANEVMGEAVEAVGGDPMDCDIWDAAWDMARIKLASLAAPRTLAAYINRVTELLAAKPAGTALKLGNGQSAFLLDGVPVGVDKDGMGDDAYDFDANAWVNDSWEDLPGDATWAPLINPEFVAPGGQA